MTLVVVGAQRADLSLYNQLQSDCCLCEKSPSYFH